MIYTLPQPNSIIFRLPDDSDGNKIFAEVSILDDGSLSDDAQAFGVDEDDSFNTLSFADLVLAVKESEDSTMSLAACQIQNDATGEPSLLYEILPTVEQLLPGLVEAYNNSSMGHTLQ